MGNSWTTREKRERGPHITVISRLKIKTHADGVGDDGAPRVKALDADGKLQLSTMASTPDIDDMDEIVEATAFASSINRFAEIPVMLAFHDMKQPVGLWPKQHITKAGLALDGFISAGRPDIQKLVLDGVIAHTSIGFFVKDVEWDDELEVLRIKDLDLIEVSLVPIPANRSTFITLSASFVDWQTRASKSFAANLAARKTRPATPAPEEGPKLPDLDELIAQFAG